MSYPKLELIRKHIPVLCLRNAKTDRGFNLGESSSLPFAKAIRQALFLQKNLSRFQSLTKREKDVLVMVAQGHCNREIAVLTFTSLHTVNTHRARLNQKLDIHHLSDVYNYAHSFDLV
jgi:DNA-binding CsgD family transcriptional regulator